MDVLRDWFSRFGMGQSAYCRKEFPQHWSSFVDAFCDTVHARGLAAVPPPHARANLKSPSSTSWPRPPTPPPAVLPPAPNRLVAIGDLHGDLDKARRALVAARVLCPETGRWCGGDTVVVQVGDVLDRGDGEIACLYLLERLSREAELAGGALHVLNGNHETMNVGGRYRYATPGGLADFLRFELVEAVGEQLRERCGCLSPGVGRAGGGDDGRRGSIRGPAHALHALAGGPAALEEAALEARARALAPGTGEITRRFLADKRVVLQVGSTVFVHGGLLPSHLAPSPATGDGGRVGSDASSALDRLNAASAAWMRGEAASGGGDSASPSRPSPSAPPTMPEFLRGRDAVVWSRSFSPEDARKADCELLRETLARLSGSGSEGRGETSVGAVRMVMGHTIQERGVNGACDGRALRVDVGLSSGCGDGRVEVLDIVADGAVPGSVRRLVEVEGGVGERRRVGRPSVVAAVPGVSPALGGGGGLPSLEDVDGGASGSLDGEDERSRWRIWSWWKGDGGGGGRATPPPPEPTPTAVSAAA